MNKVKQLITNWKIILLIVLIVISIALINPNPYNKGVAIRGVAVNSSASDAGIPPPKPSTLPMSRERIIAINNKPVDNVNDYYKIIDSFPPNVSIQIKTNKGLYKLITRIDGINDIGLSVFDAPKTNIRKGLDLQGGTRIVLQPEYKINPSDMEVLVDNMKERLNVYGLSDIIVRSAGDLSNNQYIVVEIAGTTQEEIKDLLAKQGKFEAKIGNKTVFRGGNDIKFVCRSADCAGINQEVGCQPANGEWLCGYRFTIALSQEAAERQAEATKDLDIVESGERSKYLSLPLEFYLDDIKTNELLIGSELKGKAETQVAISGRGLGINNQQAIYNALLDMKKMQTILITGSLPIKLNIIKSDSISPLLGEGFVRNSILMALLAILAVTVVLAIRYRRVMIAIPILITMLSEIIILLGVAAFIGWNIDMAAIAGILTAIGTGVDDQIVITDETLRGDAVISNWKEKIKRAFLIIMLAYFTLVVAMLPLVFAGAGLLKGFAITTIIGVTVGVFVTRPAYSQFVEIFLK